VLPSINFKGLKSLVNCLFGSVGKKALRDLTSWLGGEMQAQCLLNAAQDAERQLAASSCPSIVG
jgi:hypothetical protein